MIENGRADVVAVLIAGHPDAATVENQLGAFLDTTGDALLDRFLLAERNHRTKLRFGQIGRADFQLRGIFLQQGGELVGDGFLHAHSGQGHAALTGAAIGRINDALDRALQHAIFHDQRMVLRLREGLDALAGATGGLVDVHADGGRTDERDALDVRIHQQAVGLDAATGDQIDDAPRHAGFDQQFEHAHGGLRHHRRGLQHEGVASGDGERNHPAHGDHGREIEGDDTGEHAERLAVGHRVISGRHIHAGVALHQVMGRTGTLDDLDGLQHVAPGFRQAFAHFGGQQRGEFVQIPVEELLEAEH